MPGRFDHFHLEELQHIVGCLEYGRGRLFKNSPIIHNLIDESGEALDKQIEEDRKRRALVYHKKQ